MDNRSIRFQYEKKGVTPFYEQDGSTYANPHEHKIADGLIHVWKEWDLPQTDILDLACGSGEMTVALSKLGCKRIIASDPYTSLAFERRVGQPCLRLSFEDIINGHMAGEFSIIVCSYAMHLVAPSKLPALVASLIRLSPYLLIISPHKRPVLKPEWGYVLQHQFVHEKVHYRLYSVEGFVEITDPSFSHV